MAARVEKLAKDPDEMGELERRLRAASLKSADARAKDTGVDHIGAHVASQLRGAHGPSRCRHGRSIRRRG